MRERLQLYGPFMGKRRPFIALASPSVKFAYEVSCAIPILVLCAKLLQRVSLPF